LKVSGVTTQTDITCQLRTVALFNGHGINVYSTVQLGLLQSSSENVLQAVESDLDYLAIHHGEEVTQRRDAALVNEEADLIRRSARNSIGNRPRRLLASFELRTTHYVDQRRYYVRIYHRLDVQTTKQN